MKKTIAPLLMVSLSMLITTCASAAVKTDEKNNGVDAHQRLEKQKENLTHAKDFKEQGQTKERQLMVHPIKKGDAAPVNAAPKENDH